MPFVAVTVQIFEGRSMLSSRGSIFAESDTVRTIVDAEIQHAGASQLAVCSVHAFQAAAAAAGVELRLDHLGHFTAAMLREDFGRFLKVTLGTKEAGGVRELPSALDEMQRAQQRGQRMLPAPPVGNNFNHRIFRALIAGIKEHQLGFPLLDAEHSGKGMLRALSLALEYVLPFDAAEPSPLRSEGRVHLTIPERFSMAVRCRFALACCASHAAPMQPPSHSFLLSHRMCRGSRRGRHLTITAPSPRRSGCRLRGCSRTLRSSPSPSMARRGQSGAAGSRL